MSSDRGTYELKEHWSIRRTQLILKHWSDVLLHDCSELYKPYEGSNETQDLKTPEV